MSDHHPDGVMDREYAAGRRRAPHLKFRYRVRAQLAVDAFRGRVAKQSKHAVLELGAADGLTLLAIRELLGAQDGNQSGSEFIGIELSDELLAAVPSLPSDTRIIKGDVMRLPPEIPDGHFDLCTALAVLEHLPDPTRALREAHRALRPGGVLVATAPNPLWDDIAGKLGMVAAEHHEQELDEKALRRIVADAGFTDIEFRRFMWAPVGVLPYLKLPINPARSLEIDKWVSRVRLLDFGFVNQCIIATKP